MMPGSTSWTTEYYSIARFLYIEEDGSNEADNLWKFINETLEGERLEFRQQTSIFGARKADFMSRGTTTL